MSNTELTDDEIWEGDLMNRRESALFLYNYLIKNPQIRVLNVSSAQGTGKTFFLNRWRKALQRDHVCVIFDAWRNDFATEPLIALATAVRDQLGEETPEVQQRMQDFLHKTASTIRTTSPLVVQGLLGRLGGTGSEPAAPQDVLDHLLIEQPPIELTISAFRTALKGIFDDHKRRNPELLDDVFIIIDALDRCRPAFAIGLLERIRHFFDIEGCRFIIASDSEQLAHNTRTVHGHHLDATSYIRRLFDLNFTLPQPDYATFIHNHLPDLGDGLGYLQLSDTSLRPDVVFLEAMAESFAISFRDLERCLKRIAACHASLPLCFLPMTSGLIFFMETRPSDYKKYGPRGLAEQYARLGITNMPYSSAQENATAMGTFAFFIQYLEWTEAEIQKALQKHTPHSLSREILSLIWQNLQQFQNCQKAVEIAAYIE